MADGGYPWFRVFPSDLLAKTRPLSAAQSGIFFTILMTMMDRGEPLENTVWQLARLCNAPRGTAFEKALVELMSLGLLHTTNEGKLWSSIAQSEVDFRSKKSTKAAESVSKRWEKKRNDFKGRSIRTKSIESESESESESSSLPSSATSAARYEKSYEQPPIIPTSPPERDENGDYIITHDRPEWPHWIDFIRRTIGKQAVEEAWSVGEIKTAKRLPTDPSSDARTTALKRAQGSK